MLLPVLFTQGVHLIYALVSMPVFRISHLMYSILDTTHDFRIDTLHKIWYNFVDNILKGVECYARKNHFSPLSQRH